MAVKSISTIVICICIFIEIIFQNFQLHASTFLLLRAIHFHIAISIQDEHVNLPTSEAKNLEKLVFVFPQKFPNFSGSAWLSYGASDL